MNKLSLILTAFFALTVACGGVEGDDTLEASQEIIGDDPLVRETTGRCPNEGSPCHVYVGQGTAQRCLSGKILCPTPTIRAPHCDVLGGTVAYEPGRCLAGPDPHAPGGLTPR